MEQKICQNCNKPFPRRDNENNYRYTRRKYCSPSCYNQYMRKNKLGWYSMLPPLPKDESNTPETTVD